MKREFSKFYTLKKKKRKRQAPKRKSVSRDVRIAVNTIRQSLVLVTKSGIDVKTEEEDSEDFYTITVKIPKEKVEEKTLASLIARVFLSTYFSH